MRRRLRVFLSKHFYRNKYDYRIEWLRFIQTLSMPEEGVDTRDNCRARHGADHRQPGGVLFLRGDDSGEFKVAGWRWPPGDFTESQRATALLAHRTTNSLSFLRAVPVGHRPRRDARDAGRLPEHRACRRSCRLGRVGTGWSCRCPACRRDDRLRVARPARQTRSSPPTKIATC